MMPGVTYLPVASTTRTPAGAVRFFPIRAILPFWIKMSVFCSVPLIAVITVAFLIKTSFLACANNNVGDIIHIAINNKKTILFLIIFAFFLFTFALLKDSSFPKTEQFPAENRGFR